MAACVVLVGMQSAAGRKIMIESGSTGVDLRTLPLSLFKVRCDGRLAKAGQNDQSPDGHAGRMHQPHPLPAL